MIRGSLGLYFSILGDSIIYSLVLLCLPGEIKFAFTQFLQEFISELRLVVLSNTLATGK